MNPEDKAKSEDSIEAHIGADASHVIVGKDISSVSIENTEGGIYNSMIAGRDVHVHGDQTTIRDISDSDAVAIGRGAVAKSVKNFFFGEPADVVHQRNRRTMLNLVTSTWIEGVLEQSLHNVVLIDLNLETRIGAVDYPWEMIIRTSDQDDHPFPEGTKISDVFAKVNQSMLILGEPGSGKTTTLLELARDLLAHAELDHTQPIPVVFNLSSWVEKRQSLEGWLVDEFNVKYRIPKKLAQSWVDNDELLLLLDGLDEVREAHREECVRKINDFRQNHLVPMTICSRIVEYEALTNQLRLQGAVVLQPLTPRQIDDYLTAAGHRFQSVSNMLQQDTTLQELAQSPLLLSIMTLAYQNMPIEDIQTLNSTEARRIHLFDAYITKMFARTARALSEPYPKDQTIQWLSWLATRMVQHGQTLFLIEQMQPNWAQSTKRSRFAVYTAMLMWGPIYGLISGISGGLIVGLLDRLVVGISGGLVGGLVFEISGGLVGGLVFGLVFGLSDGVTGRFREIKLSEQLGVPRPRIRSSLYSALLWGLVSGLSGGLSSGLFFGLSGGVVGAFREIQLTNPFEFSREKLIFGLRGGLIFGLIVGLRSGLIVGLIVGLISGLIVGLIVGLISGLIFKPRVDIDAPKILVTQKSNQGIKLSAKYAIITGLVVGLVLGLVVGLVLGLKLGLGIGLFFGLPVGAISGGDIVTKHYILRLILWWKGYIPWNYASFLDYCHERILLRKVGGGYIFIHRMLLEHFAQLDEQGIQRLTSVSKNVRF